MLKYLLMFTLFSTVSLQMLLNQLKTNTNFNECILNTVNNYFNTLNNELIIIVNLEENYEPLKFLQQINTPLIILNNIKNLLNNYRNILIYGCNKNVSDFTILLKQFGYNRNILIINDGGGINDFNNIRHLLASNWKFHLNKIGFMEQDQNGIKFI